jgi:RNA polymerase sigma factor (TIGR02999 family)
MANPSTPPDRPGSSEELLPLVYDELRRLARARTARGPAGLTLQPTALVHEAYLRLVGPEGDEVRWDRRGHFFAAAAMAMRRILVERARHHKRLARGSPQQRVDLDADRAAIDPATTDLVALDEALDQLADYDARKAQVVMLRYFAGLTVEETAQAMDLSPATIKNEWMLARAWLNRALAANQTS